MFVFFEHDANGDLVSVIEVHTAEGTDVEPPVPGMTPEQKQDRNARVQAAIQAKEDATIAELNTRKSNFAGLVVLPKGHFTPTHGEHKYDLATKKVRPMTGAERAAWAKAHAPAGTAANPTTP